MNVRNTSGNPRKNCVRPVCSKKIPLKTPSGRLKPAFRLKEQKYCSPACARLHYFEEHEITQDQLRICAAAMDRFIYPPELRVAR